MKKRTYQEPSVKEIRVNIEKGFAASAGVNGYADEGCAGMLEEGNTYEW